MALTWRWFAFAALFELGLGLAAILLGDWAGRPVLGALAWNVPHAIWGVIGTIPLFAILLWLLNSSYAWSIEIVRFLDQHARPVFAQWSLAQLAVLSVLAGFGEELLFRGFIQSELARIAGPAFAFIAASALFGVFHCVTRGYAVLAGVIGAYLSLLWMLSGNLLVPAITHSVYDFAALVYFFRLRQSG